MGKGKTSRYYAKLKRENPQKYKDTRIAQQTRYNKSGKGNKIAREATALNRKLGTYGKNDGKDASHNCNGPGKHCSEDESKNRARPRKKNKNKLYIT